MAFTTPWPSCACCRAIPKSLFYQPSTTSQTFEGRRQYNFQAAFLALRESASRGCHACTLFYGAVREPYKSQLHTAPVFLESLFVQGTERAKTTAITADLNRINRSEGSAEFNLKSPTYQCPYGRFEFAPIGEMRWAGEEEGVPASAKNYKDLVSLYQDDEDAYEHVKTFLNKCIDTHWYSCNWVAWPDSPFLTRGSKDVTVVAGKRGLTTAPTRLVDVGSSDGTELPRVVPGAKCLHHENPGYIALSHCNGFVPDHPPWQLTSQTQATFEECLPLYLFPQTLRDAMEWTRRLGDRFIWIDNLCIIQDSEEDWNLEAMQMASIYGSATVTLVAAAGSIYGGMTDRRNPLRNSTCCLELSDGTETDSRVYLLPSTQNSAPRKAIPTESRGWCYQEDVLSPRLVRFSLNGIQWQCRGDEVDLARAQGLERLARYKTYQWHMLWYILIERYSNKQLSFGKDKLSAFSGIASTKVPWSGNDSYVAGICKADVWTSLLWVRDNTSPFGNPGRRYSTYVAPSWSRASLDVPVLFREAKNKALKKLEPIQTQWDPQLRQIMTQNVTFNGTGPVSAGKLIVSASSVTATTTLDQPNAFSAGRTQSIPGSLRLISSKSRTLIGEITYDCASEAREHDVLHCILLHIADTDQRLERGVAGVGIALKALTDSATEKEYGRIGYVEFTSEFVGLAEYLTFRIL